jgi:uncharacterized protein (DUF2164 family)
MTDCKDRLLVTKEHHFITPKFVLLLVVGILAAEAGLDVIRWSLGEYTYFQDIIGHERPITLKQQVEILEERLDNKRERIEILESRLNSANNR